MKIILLKDLPLGKAGDIKAVSDGYATNYLLPKKLAVVATEANIAIYRNKKIQTEKAADQKQDNYQKLAKTLDKQSVVFTAKVSENDNLFKAISNKDVIDAIKERFGLELDDKWLKKNAHFKKLGKHSLAITFPNKTKITLTVEIKPE